MIRNKLKKLKENKKTKEIKLKEKIEFADTEDMDDELLYELIPIKDEFTCEDSLSFNRQKLTVEEEMKFKKEISNYVRSLIKAIDTPNIEYLLDYINRKYILDTFNSEDLIFLLLPFPKFYEKVFLLSKNNRFLNFFSFQNKFSIRFIAIQCIKNVVFLDFIINYFEYFDDVKGFLIGVLREMFILNTSPNQEHYMRYLKIIQLLIEKNEIELMLEMYNEILKATGFECEQLKKLITPFLKPSNDNKSSQKEIEHTENDFKHIFEKKCDRKLVANYELLYSYIVWLISTPSLNLKNSSLSLAEICLVLSTNITNSTVKKFLLKHKNVKIEDGISLIKEINNKSKFINLKKKREWLIKIFNFLNNEEIVNIIKNNQDIDFVLQIINEDNYLYILSNLNRRFFDENSLALLKKCLNLINFEFSPFEEFIENESILYLFEGAELNEGTYTLNLLNVCLKRNIDLVEHILKLVSVNNVLFNYLISVKYNFTEKQILKIFNIFKEKYTDKKSLVLFISFLDNIKNNEILNEILTFMIKNEILDQSLYKFIDKNRSIIGKKILDELISRVGIKKEVLFALEENLKYDDTFLFTILNNKEYDTLRLLRNSWSLCDLANNPECFIEHFDFFKEIITHASLEESKNFLKMCFSVLNDCESEYKKILETILSSECLFKILIEFHDDKFWNIAKTILKIGIEKNKRMVTYFWNYLLKDVDLLCSSLYEIYQIMEKFITIREIDDKTISNIIETIDINQTKKIELLFNLSKHKIDLLPFIPRLVPILINYKGKPEMIALLLNKYENLLVPYLKEILNIWIDEEIIKKEIVNLDPYFLFKEISFLYHENDDSSDSHSEKKNTILNFLIYCFSQIDIDDKKVLGILIPLIEKNIGNLRLLLSFLKSLKLHSKRVSELIRLSIKLDEVKTYEVFEDLLKHSCVHFKDFAKISLHKCIKEKKLYVVKSLSLYLNKTERSGIDCALLSRFILEQYKEMLPNPKEFFIECLINILNHSKKVEIIENVNSFILNEFQNKNVLYFINLLMELYKNVDLYELCLAQSAPYFALIIDSKDTVVKSKSRMLMSVIEKKTGQSPYTYFT